MRIGPPRLSREVGTHLRDLRDEKRPSTVRIPVVVPHGGDCSGPPRYSRYYRRLARSGNRARTSRSPLPTAPRQGPGHRPLISYAIGTHGTGANCAPSKLLPAGVTSDAARLPMFEYDLPDIAAALARGMAVVVTDHQGLEHLVRTPYLQPIPEARYRPPRPTQWHRLLARHGR